MLKFVSGFLVCLIVAFGWAGSKSDPRLQYLGAITINSQNPKALAAWYTEKLGVDVSSEYHGYYYGGFPTKSGDFYLGIHPLPAGAKTGSPNISITLKIADFQSYISDLRRRGLISLREENDKTGHFVTFKDLDGNEVTIWGD